MELRFATKDYQLARAFMVEANACALSSASKRLAMVWLNKARARLLRAMRAACASLGRAYIKPVRSV